MHQVHAAVVHWQWVRLTADTTKDITKRVLSVGVL